MSARIRAAYLLCSVLATAAAPPICAQPPDKGVGVRREIGPVPVLKAMRAAIPGGAEVFSKDGSFAYETLTYLGPVEVSPGHGFQVALLETAWGQAGRSTVRLLVYSDAMEYLGQYSHFMPRTARVDNGIIVFDDADEAAGNTIRFTRDGPPPTVRLDGEMHVFYR